MNAILPIPADRADWLKLRQGYIGASEVAALFDAQPDYCLGRFALWQVKAGRMPAPIVDNPRTRAGLALEEAIAMMAGEQEGWDVRPGFYATHESGLGATLDRVIAAPGLNDAGMTGPGVLELKNADWIQHKRTWTDGEPPMHILLQLQAQLLTTGYSWGAIAALVGGNDLRIYRYVARPRLHADMAQRVSAFWASIQAEQAPNADASESAWRALQAINPDLEPETVEFVDDAEVNDWAKQWLHYSAIRKDAEKHEAEAKNLLMQRMGTATRGVGDGWKLSVADVAEKPATTITAEMIGQTIPGRAGSRRATIKEA
jgi:predicted phage-related endonuclease